MDDLNDGLLDRLRQPPSNTTILKAVGFLFGTFALSELSAALIVHSLALLADALTMIVDSMTYLLNMVAERKKKSGASDYTVLKMEFYIPLISVVTLLGVSVFTLNEAVNTIRDSDDTSGTNEFKDTTVLVFASVNLAIDIMSMFFFARVNKLFGYDTTDSSDYSEIQSTPRSNTNMCSAYTHVIADTLRSIAVMIAALLSLENESVNSEVADASGACVVSVLIFLSVLPLVKGLFQKWIQLSNYGQNDF